MVWYGMVWYGMVWYGMVWYGMEHSQKRASCSKSVITKPISGRVCITCTGLMITSLLSCELHAGLMQVVSSTCSKSANMKLHQV